MIAEIIGGILGGIGTAVSTAIESDRARDAARKRAAAERTRMAIQRAEAKKAEKKAQVMKAAKPDTGEEFSVDLVGLALEPSPEVSADVAGDPFGVIASKVQFTPEAIESKNKFMRSVPRSAPKKQSPFSVARGL